MPDDTYEDDTYEIVLKKNRENAISRLSAQLTMWPQVIFDLTSKGVSIKILQDKKTIKYELCIKKALTLKDIKTKSEILFNWVGNIIDSTWTIQLFIKNGSKQKIKKMAERSSKPLDEKTISKGRSVPYSNE